MHPTWTWQEIADGLARVNSKWKCASETARTRVRELRQTSVKNLTEQDRIESIAEHIEGWRELRSIAAQVILDCQAGATTVIDESTGKEELVTFKPQPNVIVGALRLIAELRVKEIELMQHAGMLPRHLGQLAIDIDLRRTTDVYIEVLQQFIPPKKLPEVESVLLKRLKEVAPTSRAALPPAPE